MLGTVKNDGGLIYPQIEYGEFWQNNGAKFLGIFLEALRQKLNSSVYYEKLILIASD